MFASTELRRYLVAGKSMTMGTVDAAGLPSACRAVGVRLHDDAEVVTVYVPVATAAKCVANIATNGRVALCVSDVVDHGTLQLKGRSRAVRVAGAGEADHVTAWHEAFVDRVAEIGMAKRVMRGLVVWPAFAIEVDVRAIYEQTPGPRAGTLVHGR